MQIGLLLFPKLTQLDLAGPYEVFARVPDATVHVVWKTRDPVACDRGLQLVPTTTFAECPQLDVICVPGGPGQVDAMDDEETLAFLRRHAAGAQWITSVCTGSLLLGAAGLLEGYRAACHWASRDQLALLGAEPVDARVVIDRNRASGGGVTAGIDFALALVARMKGEALAKAIQLGIEYAPAPPFDAGTPQQAEPPVVAQVSALLAPMLVRRRAATERAAQRLAAGARASA
jgi:cyclohexyl-isocyanide hydratase